jgi:hypothetical protein
MKRILLILMMAGTACFGQQFRGEAVLPAVRADGFYRIAVSPAFGAHLNSAFSNLRIYDRDQKEVPYIFQQEEPAYYTTQFKPYEIVSKTHQKKCCTTLTLRNPDGRPINNISLSIRNADVTKTATLLGSDDQQNWFALKQQFTLSTIDSHDHTSEIRIIDFPLSNYTYYQLQIDDSTSAPLNLLSAGHYEVTSEDGKYTAIETMSVDKIDRKEHRQTVVTLTFDTTQVIDKVVLSMAGSTYFLRRAILLTRRKGTDSKGRKEYFYDEPLQSFEVSSKQTSIIELPGTRAQELIVRIDNEDNPPLNLATVKTYQLNRYLIAWFKKGGGYTLKIGESTQRQPKYDLAFFKDNIPDQPQVITPGEIKIFGEAKKKTTPTFFTNNIIIWIAIVVVIAVLGFMAVKMTQEASKR